VSSSSCEADVDDHAASWTSRLEKAHLRRTLRLGNDRTALNACGELPFVPLSLHRNRIEIGQRRSRFDRLGNSLGRSRESALTRDLGSREKTIAGYFFFAFFADFFAFFAPFFALFLAAMTIFRPFSAFADSF
jgi:hypothetical protein